MSYSPLETKILDFLKSRKGARTTTLVVVENVYEEADRPLHANNAIVAMMKILAKKIVINNEDFRLETARRGGKPNEWWLERKSGSKRRAA